MTTTAVREVLDSVTFPLDIRTKEIDKHCVLPESLLRLEEPEDVPRLLALWAQLLRKVAHSTRMHRSRFTGVGGMKDAVYISSMENITKEFSRSTNNIKATFIAEKEQTTTRNNNKPPKYAFSLRVTRLNDVSELIRTMGRTQTAEIPFIPEEVRAEAIGTTNDVTPGNDNADDGTPIPTATVEIVDEAPGQITTILGDDDNEEPQQLTTTTPTANGNNDNRQSNATPAAASTRISSAPLVSAVAIVDDYPVVVEQEPIVNAQAIPDS